MKEAENRTSGRGAQSNTANRFLAQSYDILHPEGIDDWEALPRKTSFIFDDSRSLVNEVKSPDVGMQWSANPYQGCEHGCIYCYARNTHEYWGYSAGLDFESRIVVKQNAPQLLRQFFDKKNWTPQVISLSGNTDCYQPVERKMKLTRQLLEVCLEYKNPVGIITKNALVLRDLDLLQALAEKNLVCVFTSVTSVEEALRRKLEPRTSTYAARLKVVRMLSEKNIPTGIMNAPLIPGLNDAHMYEVLKAAAAAGARFAGYTIVRLNGAVATLFKEWLYGAFPGEADKVWFQIAACHGGSVSDSRAGTRMTGEGKLAAIIRQQFQLYTRKLGLNKEKMQWNTSDFERPCGPQMRLF